MQIFLRVVGCCFVIGCLVGLAVQHPTAGDALARGQAAEARGDWVQALGSYAQASQFTPSDPAPLIAGARLRLWAGRTDRAASDWSRAVTLAPPTPDLWVLGGQIAEAQYDPSTAAADDQRAIALAPTSAAAGDAAVALARMAFDAGDAARVPDIVRRIPAPLPPLRALLVVALVHLGQIDAAQALVADPAVAHALPLALCVTLAGWQGAARDQAALGYADLVAGWPRLAIGLLRRAVAAQPGYGVGQAYLAWALWQSGDSAGAQAALAAAQRLAPDAPITVGIAAQVRAMAGDPAGALATLTRWEGAHDPAPELWAIQAQVAAQGGAWASEADARWHLATMPASTTGRAAALLDLAAFYLRTGLGTGDGRAAWAITAAAVANPASARAQDLLGQWAWQVGQPDVAIAAFRAALARDPRDAAAHARLALVAWGVGDGTSARLEAARARALDATSVAIWQGTPLAVAVADDSLTI